MHINTCAGATADYVSLLRAIIDHSIFISAITLFVDFTYILITPNYNSAILILLLAHSPVKARAPWLPAGAWYVRPNSTSSCRSPKPPLVDVARDGVSRALSI